MGEYPRALRLASELADLRAADADRIPLRASAGGARSDGGVVFPKRKHPISGCFRFGGATRNRTGDEGFADLCLTAWLWRRRNDTRSSHGRNKEKTGTDEGSEPRASDNGAVIVAVPGRRLGFLTAPRREIGVQAGRGSKKSGKDHGILPALFWSGLRGSNPPPRPWQGRALPNELNPRSDHRSLVPPVGIEPTTRGFSVLCSTN